MTHHPKERPNSLSRRGFLLRSAGAAAAVSGAIEVADLGPY